MAERCFRVARRASAALIVAAAVLAPPSTFALRAGLEVDGAADLPPAASAAASAAARRLPSAFAAASAGRLGGPLGASAPATAGVSAAAAAARFAGSATTAVSEEPGSAAVKDFRARLATLLGEQKLERLFGNHYWDSFARAADKASERGHLEAVGQRLSRLQVLATRDQTKEYGYKHSAQDWAREVEEVHSAIASLGDPSAGLGDGAPAPVRAAKPAGGQVRRFSTAKHEPVRAQPRSLTEWADIGDLKLKTLKQKLDRRDDLERLSDEEWVALAEAHRAAIMAGHVGDAWQEIKYLRKMLDHYEIGQTWRSGDSISGKDFKLWAKDALEKLRELAARPVEVGDAEPEQEDSMEERDRRLWRAVAEEVFGTSGAVDEVLQRLDQEIEQKVSAAAAARRSMAHSSASSTSSPPSAGGAKRSFSSSIAHGAAKVVNGEDSRVHSSMGDMQLMGVFLDSLWHDSRYSRAWWMWRNLKAATLPERLRREEVILSIDGAFVLATMKNPKVAKVASGLLKGFSHGVFFDERSGGGFAIDMEDWAQRAEDLLEMLLFVGELDQAEATRFGVWVEARMVVEEVARQVPRMQWSELRDLRAALAFAAENEADSQAALIEVDDLSDFAARDKRRGHQLSDQDWGDRVQQSVKRLESLGNSVGVVPFAWPAPSL